jgi:TPR repeat protein
MQLKTELEEETLMVLLDEGHTILESYLPEANPLWSINLWNMFRELKRKEQATEAAAIMELLAERGDKVAQYNTGRHYRLGDGVPQNTARMLFWYELAAAGGLAGAQNNLAVCYNNGDGVRRDKEEAARWWTKAAEQGNVQAQFNLGAYFHDKGCMPAARSWLEKAADQGYKEAAEALRIMRKNGD